MMKTPDTNVDTNSLELKVHWKILACHKSACPLSSQYLKINCISQRNDWNKLVFSVLL